MKTVITKEALQFAKTAIYLNIFGIFFSGLVFPLLTMFFCPQPAWKDAALFVQSFNPLQTATFFCGFFLILGSLMTFVALYFVSDGNRKIWSFTALSINLVFTVVVFLNYIIQTTYVPYLAINNPPETNSVLTVFTMANPGSLAWSLEMYGWGGIGLSFIFMSVVFENAKFDHILKKLFIVNGICSVGSAIMTSVDMRWIFSPAGFISLIVWNVLVFVIDIYLLRYFNGKHTL